MGAASRYWKFVSIDGAGRRRSEEIDSAKAFFQQQFPEFAAGVDVPDAYIQRQLFSLANADTSTVPNSDSLGTVSSFELHLLPAKLCLRCFISSQIEQVCIQLETQFGRDRGFTRYDLFVLVLDDFWVGCDAKTGKQDLSSLQSSSYRSLATEILQTFAPERSSLATWTTRLVKHHREVNAFLLQHGVYLVSDWAILNDTNCNQLQRIFSSFHQLSAAEIQRDSLLLESYHAVYRRDRLASRRAGIREQCPLPTVAQLHQIAQRLQPNSQQIGAAEVMTRLQDIAELLRQYRIYARGGLPPTESLDDMQISSPDSGNDEGMQAEFLQLYRRQLRDCLDLALEKAIADRITQLRRKHFHMVQQFLLALHLFHCKGLSMSKIAPLLGLKAQYEVTRLLKLKNFRTDVRQYMLKELKSSVADKAINYAAPLCLQTLEQRIEVALEEQVAGVIQEAEVECSTPKKSASSLFTKRLCYYISTILELDSN